MALEDVPLSILDLAKVSENGNIAEAFHNSKELAVHAERLGYKRFWLAEHHSIEGIASAATAILITHIAQHTKTIRVGSGGIMLPNHSTLMVAEAFGTLETLFPGRIDLGLGRAPGADQATMRAIRGNMRAAEPDFGELVGELLYYFSEPEPGQRIRAIPGAGIKVPIYILGSSLYSARLAAKLGLPYAFAGHFAPAMMIQAFDIYRTQFEPSPALEKPYVMAGIPVIAAETDEHAEFLATSVQQTFLGIIRGDRKLLRPPVKDMNSVWSPQEKAAVQSMLGLLVTGSPEKIRKELNQFIQSVKADELIITSDTFDYADRMRSFEFIMKAKKNFGRKRDS